MGEDRTDELIERVLGGLVNWGGVAAREAEQIVQAEWHRQNPNDPITDILRARDILLRENHYRPGLR